MGIFRRLFGSQKAQPVHSPQASPPTPAQKPQHEVAVLGRTELLGNVRALNNSATQDKALAALRGQPARAVIEVITEEMLSSSDYLERGRGAYALGHLGRDYGWGNTVPLLEKLLNDDQAFVRERAVWGLDWISYNTDLKPAVADCASRWSERLVAMFAKGPRIDVLLDLSSLIELSGPRCVSPLRAVLPNLSDKMQIERATKILEKFKASPTQTKPAILEGLRSHDVARRRQACYFSVDVADSEIVAALIEVLREYPEPQYNAREDVYQSTHKGAAYALGKIGDPSAIPMLRKALEDDRPWGVERDGTLVRRITGMPAFGTSVREGLEEAGTPFAQSVLAG